MMVVENKKVKNVTTKKGLVILFFDDDYPEGFNHDHDNPMVIIAIVYNYVVKKILVGQRSLVNILHSVIAVNKNI